MTGKTWTPWTREQARQCEALRAQGLSHKAIARKLDRSPGAVRLCLYRLRRARAEARP